MEADKVKIKEDYEKIIAEKDLAYKELNTKAEQRSAEIQRRIEKENKLLEQIAVLKFNIVTISKQEGSEIIKRAALNSGYACMEVFIDAAGQVSTFSGISS